MKRHAFTVRAGDGTEIVCTSHEPAGRARCTIVIAPNGPLPRAGPFRSMTRLADLLCLAGHRVVRADLRGFGEAEADVPEATIHEHYRRIERGLHVEDLRAVTAALADDGTPLVLFGSCGGAVTSVRAAEGDARVRAVVGYALPVVLTGGRGAALTGRGGAARVVAMARLGLGEAILRGSRGRLLPGRLAPWLNVPLIRALRASQAAARCCCCSAVRTTCRISSRATASTACAESTSTSWRASVTTSTIRTTSSASPPAWTPGSPLSCRRRPRALPG